MERSNKESNENAVKHILVKSLIMPVMGILLILFYNHSLNIKFLFTRVEVHLILILFYMFSSLLAFRSHLLRDKVHWIFSGLGIFLLAECFEPSNTETVGDFFRGGFSTIWVVLAVPSIFYLIINTVRIIRWGQETWEEIQQVRYAECLRVTKARNLEKEKEEEHESEIRKKHRQQKDEDKDAKNAQKVREREFQEELDAIHKFKKIVLEITKESDDKRKVWRALENAKSFNWNGFGKVVLYITSLMVATLVMALFILLPRWGTASENKENIDNNISTVFASWIDDVRNFMEEMDVSKSTTAEMEPSKKNIEQSAINAIVGYIVFFITFLVCFLSLPLILQYIIYQILCNAFFHKKKKSGLLGMWREYGTPLSILIVAFSILSSFIGGAGEDEWLVTFFYTLAFTILAVMLFLIAVDVVRLIVNQCMERGSLLRTVMHLIFTLLVKCVSGIALSVVGEFQIQEIFSSLVSILIPEIETENQSRAVEILDEAYDLEMEDVRKNLHERNSKRKSSKQSSGFQNEYETTVQREEWSD